jgi:hypothetical protein
MKERSKKRVSWLAYWLTGWLAGWSSFLLSGDSCLFVVGLCLPRPLRKLCLDSL